MKLAELVMQIVDGSYGFIEPPESIELSNELVALFRQTWNKSEYIKREMGANLIGHARGKCRETMVRRPLELETQEPIMNSNNTETSSNTNSNNNPIQNGIEPDEYFKLKNADEIKVEEFSLYGQLITGPVSGADCPIPEIDISGNFADFHTHPSDPSTGSTDGRGYQPPSIEDVIALAGKKNKRKIYISFVVTKAKNVSTEIYAMLYLKAYSKIKEEKLTMLLEKKKEEMEKLKFPTQQLKMQHFEGISKFKFKTTEQTDQEIALYEQNYLAKIPQYGEKLATMSLAYLKQACTACGLGLYRGVNVLNKIN